MSGSADSDSTRGFLAKARDNETVIIPRAFSQERQFASAVAEVEKMLYPQVLRIRYSLDDDWMGEPAVFFRILLSEAASRRDQLLTATKQASRALEEQIEPLEQWGVVPYFNFRSQSEQAALREEAWA